MVVVRKNWIAVVDAGSESVLAHHTAGRAQVARRRKAHVLRRALEIVKLGILKLGTWRKQRQGFYEKTNLAPNGP